MRLPISRFALLCLLLAAALPTQAGSVRLWSVSHPTNTQQLGYVRISNPAAAATTVEIFGFDDKGSISGPATITIQPRQSVILSSQDLKAGNASLGLTGGLGEPTGEWWLELYALEDILVSGYVRTQSGLLNDMSDTVEPSASAVVPMFNGSSNTTMRSELRIVNPNPIDTAVEITGVDDAGNAGASVVKVTVPGFGAVRLTAEQLETGTGNTAITAGKLSLNSPKWRLTVNAAQSVRVLSLVRGDGGYLSNISTVAEDLATDIPTCGDLNGASLFSQEARPVYLGFLGAASGDSIFNTSGEFGSSTGAKSVHNANSEYGSATGAFSAKNPWTDTPPLIIRNGRILGALTSSLYYTTYRRISLTALTSTCKQLTATKRQGF